MGISGKGRIDDNKLHVETEWQISRNIGIERGDHRKLHTGFGRPRHGKGPRPLGESNSQRGAAYTSPFSTVTEMTSSVFQWISEKTTALAIYLRLQSSDSAHAQSL